MEQILGQRTRLKHANAVCLLAVKCEAMAQSLHSETSASRTCPWTEARFWITGKWLASPRCGDRKSDVSTISEYMNNSGDYKQDRGWKSLSLDTSYSPFSRTINRIDCEIKICISFAVKSFKVPGEHKNKNCILYHFYALFDLKDIMDDLFKKDFAFDIWYGDLHGQVKCH